MLSYCAKRISSFFVYTNIVKKEELEVYTYCFEILLATILNFTVLLIVALVTGTLWRTVFFLIGFLPLRRLAGGYHADTHFRCFLIMLGVYFAFLVAQNVIPIERYLIATIVCVSFSVLLIWLLAPVEAKNKPLSKKEKIFFRKRSRWASLIYVVAILLSIVVFGIGIEVLSVSLGILAVAGSLFATWVKENVIKAKML